MNIHPHPARPAAAPPSPVKGEGPDAAPSLQEPLASAWARGTKPSPLAGEGGARSAPGERVDATTSVPRPRFSAKARGTKPSPLAGEGGARSAPGEGAKLRRKKQTRQVATETKRARALRKRPTDAEESLWAMLRQPPFRTAKFRRQVPVGRYIVDFVSYPARLVIEVDGSQHAGSIADRLRDHWLTVQGFKVRRYWNSDVLTNAEGVGADIATALGRARLNEEVKR